VYKERGDEKSQPARQKEGRGEESQSDKIRKQNKKANC
jgi:hypothetical protein